MFASASNLWSFEEWAPNLSIPENVARLAPLLARFCDRCEPEALDGIVLELPGSSGETVEDLAATTGEVLASFCRLDPAGARCLDAQVDRPGWWYTFADVELFLLTFAPCYPDSHPRSSCGLDAVYIVFQPRTAFFRRRGGQPSIASAVRKRIRAAFAQRGQPYDPTLADSLIEAHQFVKPLHLGDPPVHWWRDPSAAATPDAGREVLPRPAEADG